MAPGSSDLEAGSEVLHSHNTRWGNIPKEQTTPQEDLRTTQRPARHATRRVRRSKPTPRVQGTRVNKPRAVQQQQHPDGYPAPRGGWDGKQCRCPAQKTATRKEGSHLSSGLYLWLRTQFSIPHCSTCLVPVSLIAKTHTVILRGSFVSPTPRALVLSFFLRKGRMLRLLIS